ncbi:MAG: FHA domain-containing protein [Acidimicrobiales bacterium]
MNIPLDHGTAPGHDRVIPVDGDGLVARWTAGTVVVGGDETTRAAALAVLAPAGRPPTAVELVDRLRHVPTPHLAAVVTVPGGRRAICRGAGAAVALDGDPTTVAAPAPASGAALDSEASAPDGSFWLGFGPVPFDHETIRVGPIGLEAGVVAGRGALIDPGAAEPAPVPPVAVPAPAPAAFELADLRPQEPLGPLPIAAEPGRVTVKGIECSRGHFNNPTAAYCSQCGISLVHLTHRLVDGVRPALGFLVFDDGTTFTLDRSYLIGREPEPDDTSLTALVATDPDQTVSRSHAELVLDDWDVSLCDLGSTNGTFVWRVDQQRWEPVLPNRPVAITAGTRVAVGRRTFVYEALGRSA